MSTYQSNWQPKMDLDMQDESCSFTALESHSFPATTTAPMNHNSLTMRPNRNLSQASSSLASQQKASQPAADTNSTRNPDAPMIHSALTFNDLHRMASETALMAARRNLMDPGNQSLEDVEFFLRNLHYPARNISNVQILIGYSIRTRGRGLLESNTVRCHPASACTTFADVMEATKTDWEDAFLDLSLSPPAEGIQSKDLMIWYRRTYGDNQYDWIEARRHGDYTKWFRDYVIHGRSSVLHLLLRYKGSINEQLDTSTVGGASLF